MRWMAGVVVEVVEMVEEVCFVVRVLLLAFCCDI
jgi:hypothetical protein